MSKEAIPSSRNEVKVNPQMALACLHSVSPEENLFRVGIVVRERAVTKQAVAAIGNFLSNCILTYIVLISDAASLEGADEEIFEQYNIRTNTARLLRGEDGFCEMLASPDVDAVYVIVPNEHQRQYAIPALDAKKHVLLDDPVSTSYTEFLEQLAHAQTVTRYLQFPTMFVHQHRVMSFLDCVTYEKFGSIESVDVKLLVNIEDMKKLGVTFPLKPGQGCIRRLGRYCNLITALMFSRAGGIRPDSAKVVEFTLSETGEPVNAVCQIHYTDNRVLRFHVGYTIAPTRQVMEVRSHDRYATVTDFVIPHPDGLATYRIYDKEKNPKTNALEVVRGEALDIPQGPSQFVVMWRRFRELCLSIEEFGWGKCPENALAREITSVSLQTKRILTALEESQRQGCKEIAIALEEVDVH